MCEPEDERIPASVPPRHRAPRVFTQWFPIASTVEEFRQQARRLTDLPAAIVARLERAQPYHSAYGPPSNLLYWLHELARVDRHRRLHLGLGRVSRHRVGVGVPHGIAVVFDEGVRPYAAITRVLVIARFTTSVPLPPSLIQFNPMVEIAPEIAEWADFEMNGSKPPLDERMRMTELFMRNHLENMAYNSNVTPPQGFRTIELPAAS